MSDYAPVNGVQVRVVFRVERDAEMPDVWAISGSIQAYIPDEYFNDQGKCLIDGKVEDEWLVIGETRGRWVPDWDFGRIERLLYVMDAESADALCLAEITNAYLEQGEPNVWVGKWLGVEWMEIQESWRGFGVSNLVMRAWLDSFAGGCDSMVVLMVHSDHSGLVRHYKAFGFEEVSFHGEQVGMTMITALVPPEGSWLARARRDGIVDEVTTYSGGDAPFVPALPVGEEAATETLPPIEERH